MSQPPPYNPVTSFLTYQAQQAWFPGQQLDVEFNGIHTAIAAIEANLAILQNDDLSLGHGLVGWDQFSPSLQLALRAQGFTGAPSSGPNTWLGLQTFPSGIYINGAPANAAFPGNAPSYVTVPNAPASYSSIYNGFQVSMGTPILASGQFGESNVGIQQTFVATLNVASTDAAGNAGFALAGYGITNSIHTGAVGVGGFGMCGASGCNEIDGGNFVVANAPALQGAAGFDYTLMLGVQVNINLRQKSPGVNPSGPLYGLYVVGGGDATNNTGWGFAVDQLSIVTGAKWSNAFISYNGAAVVALSVGTNSGTQAAPPSTSGSQQVVFNGYITSSARSAILEADPFGNFIIEPGFNTGGSTVLRDGFGNAILTVGTGATGVAATTTTVASSLTAAAMTLAGGLALVKNLYVGVGGINVISLTSNTGLILNNGTNNYATLFGNTGGNDGGDLALLLAGVKLIRLSANSSVVNFINSGGNFVLGGTAIGAATVFYTNGGGLQLGTPTGSDLGAGTLNAAGSIRAGGGFQVGTPTGGDKGTGTANLAAAMYVAGTQVVSTRATGWTVATGTPQRSTFTTGGVTLAQLAGVVMALEQDLIAHGLIGT